MIGLDRNLHHKPGLVALGSALAVLAVAHERQAHIQGVIMGVGFIGAGVILHRATSAKLPGMTTAASIWVTAALGVLCGLDPRNNPPFNSLPFGACDRGVLAGRVPSPHAASAVA